MKDYIKANQEVYDRLAQEYRAKLKDYIISDRIQIAPFIRYLNNNFTEVKVLELGSGSGLCLSYFEAEGFYTTAIDISSKIINVSKKIAPKTKYVCGDFLGFDFGAQQYNGIFAKAFIHLFTKEDAITILKKIFDLIVENGIAFVATTVHKKPEEGFFEKSDYNVKLKRFRKKWTENELLEEVTKAGFRLVDKSYNIEKDNGKKWMNLLLAKASD